MKRIGPAIYRLCHIGLAAAATSLLAFPAFGQDSSSVSITTDRTSTTTSTSTDFISDWRLWAIVGAVLLVIIIIAVTRRGGGDTTTIVK